MNGADVPLEPASAKQPHPFASGGPASPHRPARVRPWTPGRRRVVRPEDVKLTWYGPKTIPPDVMKLLFEAELEALEQMEREALAKESGREPVQE